MARPSPDLRGRLLTLAVVSVLGVLASARESLASGCHVEERPRFGLTVLGERPDDGLIIRDRTPDSPSHWAPRPCSDDSHASSVRAMTIVSALPLDLGEIATLYATGRILPSDQRGAGRMRWSDLSRPPR